MDSSYKWLVSNKFKQSSSMRKLYDLEAHKETAFLSIESLMRSLAELWERPAGIKVDGPGTFLFHNGVLKNK